jgi:RNA polymerase sigma factor (sigma-70 family)
MSDQGPAIQPEILLDEWLREADAERARRQLELLVTGHLEPLIRRIVGFKLASWGEGGGRLPRADVEDVSQDAMYSLLARLERMKFGDGSAAVRDFTAYAAVTAYNACNEYFRSKRPVWLSLSMKIRYVATHLPRFAIWRSGEGREACGFASDFGQEALTDFAELKQACEDLRRQVDPRRLGVAELMDALLRAAARPVAFELLVDLAAELSGLAAERVKPIHEVVLRDDRPAADQQLIQRNYIQRVWKEIRELPLEHRRALLLNLNDAAGGDIRLFEAVGVASVRQIAETLEMDSLEFAALWKELPLDDTRIAQLLGISRLDVSNRRSAARKRLARRMQESKSGV